jgi:hypothetical protein
MLVGSWRALARGLVFAASLVAPTLGLAQPQPQGAAHTAAPFAFQRLAIDQSGLQPVVCLRFTGALRGEGVRNSDYLAIAPDPQPGLRVEGQALCLTGQSYGSAYEIDLRQGLPGRWVGQARKTPHHTNVQKQAMMMTETLGDTKPQVLLAQAQVQHGTAQDHYEFRLFGQTIKSVFRDDPAWIAARKTRNDIARPYTQWTSDDLILIYNHPKTRIHFLVLHDMFKAARGGQGDPVAIEELRGLAPIRCNRDFQCFRSIFNDAIDRINSQPQRGSIEEMLPELKGRAVAALSDSSITLADSDSENVQLSLAQKNLAANLSAVRPA